VGLAEHLVGVALEDAFERASLLDEGGSSLDVASLHASRLQRLGAVGEGRLSNGILECASLHEFFVDIMSRMRRDKPGQGKGNGKRR
jgi:hypothetical protein